MKISSTGRLSALVFALTSLVGTFGTRVATADADCQCNCPLTLDEPGLASCDVVQTFPQGSPPSGCVVYNGNPCSGTCVQSATGGTVSFSSTYEACEVMDE